MTNTFALLQLDGLLTLPAFRPHAYGTKREVMVFNKDCSLNREWLPGYWAQIFWEKERPIYAPWRNCVGFTFRCEPQLNFSGEVLVTDILDWIERQRGHPIEKYRSYLYGAARDILVRLPA